MKKWQARVTAFGNYELTKNIEVEGSDISVACSRACKEMRKILRATNRLRKFGSDMEIRVRAKP